MKQILTFFSKESCSSISGNGNPPPPPKICIFSNESCSHILGNGNPEKEFFIIQETELSYISGNRNRKKTSHFRKYVSVLEK